MKEIPLTIQMWARQRATDGESDYGAETTSSVQMLHLHALSSFESFYFTVLLFYQQQNQGFFHT